MTKNHYIQIAVMSLVILIASVLFGYYYKNYVAPESYTIGSLTGGDYKELAIKDYLSDETVLFSQNINDVSFKVENGTATYDYNFDVKDFNGLENNYLIYVNNYIVNNLTTNAGVISGTYNLNYQDVNNDTLCASNINISFTFRSLSSVLRVTLPANDLGYLMNYFKSDNFIITLALSPFEFGNKDGEVDEKVNQIIELTNQVNSLSGQISTLNGQITDYIQQIADLTNAGEDKAEQISELQSNISSLQSQISSLNSQLSEKSEELNTIQTENAELLEENTSLSALVVSQQETITSLNQTISELQYQVSYYEELLEAYQNSEKLAVTFKVNNEAYLVQLVDLLGYPTEPTEPTKENYDFLGWSINGTDIVDVTTIQITQDTTFIAIFKDKYGLFDSNNQLLMSWNDLISNGYFVEDNGTLSEGTVDRTGLSGKLIIPNDIIVLSESVFEYCSNLTEIILSENLTTIGARTFYGCSSLTSIYLPENVVTIYSNFNSAYTPFWGCSNISAIYCYASETLEGWEFGWNYRSTTRLLTVNYNYTYEQYLTEISSNN